MNSAANTMSGRRPFTLRVPGLETVAAWLLAMIWIFPLLYAVWAAFHPPAYMVRFDLFAPLTLDNFANAWAQAPFARYYLNTFLLDRCGAGTIRDRKSTRLNSSHVAISYAVFCLHKQKTN